MRKSPILPLRETLSYVTFAFQSECTLNSLNVKEILAGNNMHLSTIIFFLIKFFFIDLIQNLKSLINHSQFQFSYNFMTCFQKCSGIIKFQSKNQQNETMQRYLIETSTSCNKNLSPLFHLEIRVYQKDLHPKYFLLLQEICFLFYYTL